MQVGFYHLQYISNLIKLPSRYGTDVFHIDVTDIGFITLIALNLKITSRDDVKGYLLGDWRGGGGV